MYVDIRALSPIIIYIIFFYKCDNIQFITILFFCYLYRKRKYTLNYLNCYVCINECLDKSTKAFYLKQGKNIQVKPTYLHYNKPLPIKILSYNLNHYLPLICSLLMVSYLIVLSLQSFFDKQYYIFL